MSTFFISVTETLNRVIAVEAEDLYEAFEKAEEAANSGEVNLTDKDFVGREFENETEEVVQCIREGYVEESMYQSIK